MDVSKTTDHMFIKIKMPNPSQEVPASSKSPNEDLNNMDVLCTFKIRASIENVDVLKISDHIQTKILMPTPNQEPPATCKPKKKLKVRDVFAHLGL